MTSDAEEIMKRADAHWSDHCFTKHVDVEELMAAIKKSKIKKELKEQIETLVEILFCNERIIHYRTSINYFLEKLVDACPTCEEYSYRIVQATPKPDNSWFYICELTCERCKRHRVDIMLPFKVVQEYCRFHQIEEPNQGDALQDFNPTLAT